MFIGNLDENVDERLLYDTFSAFGIMATTAKVRSLRYDVDAYMAKEAPVDCTRPDHGTVKRLRFRLVHGFRVV